MSRLLHLGDTHIDEKGEMDDTAQALAQVADIAKRERVDAILWPGDVYGKETNHKATPNEEEVAKAFLESVAPIPVVICRGNHDAPKTCNILGLAPHVTVFEHPGLMAFTDFDLAVFPWPERSHLAALGHTGEGGLQAAQQALGDLIRGLCASRPKPDRPLCIMGHLSVCGAICSSGQPLVGREIQVIIQDITDTGAVAICLNHIHLPQTFYAGSLTIQDFGEEREEKRVVILEGGSNPGELFRTTDIPIKGRKWITIEGQICDGLATWFPSLPENSAKNLNIRFRYSCTEEEAHLFDHKSIERLFEDAHSLKIVPKVTRSQRVRAAEVTEAKSVEEKLAAWGVVTGTEITGGMLHKLETLKGGA